MVGGLPSIHGKMLGPGEGDLSGAYLQYPAQYKQDCQLVLNLVPYLGSKTMAFGIMVK